MPITQVLLTATTSGGGGGPPPDLFYPPTLAATGGSLYFGSTATKMQIADSLSDFAVGTGDFTVEWWQWMLDSSSPNARIFSMGDWPTTKLGFSLENGQAYLWGQGAGGANNNAGSFTYTPADLYNTWTHIAINRTSGITQVYFNGSSVLATGNSYNVVTAENFVIGNQYGQNAGFVGYIKDFRFVNGVGVRPSDFTPPLAQLTATAETKLLLSVNSSITSDLDDSASPHSVGNAGVNYADVGPYDLALYVDAGNSNSLNVGDLSTWTDLSSANNNLTLTNVSWTSLDGGRVVFNNGLGTMGYAESPSTIATSQTALTPRSSISFWGIIQSNNNFQHIAGMRGGDKFHMVLLNNNQSLECRVETSGGDVPGYFDGMPTIGTRLNTMTHYAFVVNGTQLEVYINGVLTSQASVTGLNTGTLGAFTIARAAGGFQAENLEIGELRYYNRARSPKEIAREFAATRTRYGV
jgi:hypothetical protein